MSKKLTDKKLTNKDKAIETVELKRRNGRWDRPLDVLSPPQASQLLRLTAGALNRQGRLGLVKMIKVGKLSFYPAQEIRRLILMNNTSIKSQKLIAQLEEFVEENNADIRAREESRGRGKNT